MNRLRTAVLLAALAAPIGAMADQGRTILVLDASGSMWGQIEGEAKISIAQGVVRDLLNSLPEDQELGLTVYGHRRKGDCSDIETLVMPGPDSRDAIARAVNGLSPKGKTPLSAAVMDAARALRHTEEKATVILVSDGIETCAADPCAVGAELEASGVDFTAHVVGFDISDPEAKAQLQCLATNTGGSYLEAKSARELGDALREVAEARPEAVTEPEPEPTALPEITIDGPDQAPAGAAVQFFANGFLNDHDFLAVFDSAGEMLTYRTMVNGGAVTLEMPKTPGAYELRYLNEGRANKVAATRPITIVALEPALSAPDTAPAATQINVTWVGPATEWDFLTIAAPQDQGGYISASDYLVSGGNPIAIFTPDTPGSYELRYIYGANREILVRRPITVE